jgi:hypothetical protein
MIVIIINIIIPAMILNDWTLDHTGNEHPWLTYYHK